MPAILAYKCDRICNLSLSPLSPYSSPSYAILSATSLPRMRTYSSTHKHTAILKQYTSHNIIMTCEVLSYQYQLKAIFRYTYVNYAGSMTLWAQPTM